MNYEWYSSLSEAAADIPYKIITREQLAGMPLANNIRWLDLKTDIFFQSYIGFAAQPNGTSVVDRILLLLQGRGDACSMNNTGAPADQRGSLRFADGRVGNWAIGIDRHSWRSGLREPVWVAWPSKDGEIVRRLEAVDIPIEQLRQLARSLAAQD